MTDTVDSLATTETRIQLGNYYVQAKRVDVAQDAAPAEDGVIELSGGISGTVGTVIAPTGATLRTGDGSGGNEGSITLTEPYRVGDLRVHGQIPSQVNQGDYVLFFVWSDTLTSSFSGTREYFGLLNATLDYPTKLTSQSFFNPQQLTIPPHTPSGVDLVDKQLKFGVWSSNDSDSSATFHSYIDHISIKQTVDGDPIDQTSFSILADQSGREIEIEQFIGDGPTGSHPHGLKLAGVDVTQDWQIGPYESGGSPSGTLIEEVTAEAAMRQQRDTATRWSRDLELRGVEDIWPHYVYEIDGDLYTITYLQRTWKQAGGEARVELTERNDATI